MGQDNSAVDLTRHQRQGIWKDNYVYDGDDDHHHTSGLSGQSSLWCIEQSPHVRRFLRWPLQCGSNCTWAGQGDDDEGEEDAEGVGGGGAGGGGRGGWEGGVGGGGGVPNKNGEHGRDLVLNAWCKLELRNRLKTLARCSLKCLFWTMFDVLVMF